jgi:hypothetical protein
MKTKQGQKIDTIFVLMVFCVFAAMVLTVLTLGARIYKNTAALAREGYNGQTCLSYIWSKVKNEDEAGRIYVDDFNGAPALCFGEEYDGETYRTVIYLYNGRIYELFCGTGLSFPPEDGTPVIEAEVFSVKQLDNGLIKAETDTGSLLIYPRSKGV